MSRNEHRSNEPDTIPGQASRSSDAGPSTKRLVDCIIMASVGVEFAAMRLAFESFGSRPRKDIRDAHDLLCFDGTLKVGDRDVRCFYVQSPRYGLPWSAALASTLISLFRPHYVFMTGICCGDHRKTELGDIVMPKQIIDYESGKRIPDSFLPQSTALTLSSSLSFFVNDIANDKELAAKIHADYPKDGGRCPDKPPKFHTGSMACGLSVIEDNPKTFNDIQKHHRDIAALDMESYGLACAVDLLNQRNCSVEWAVVKAVSDYGVSPSELELTAQGKIEGKNDSLQRYSSYTSAAVIRQLITRLYE